MAKKSGSTFDAFPSLLTLFVACVVGIMLSYFPIVGPVRVSVVGVICLIVGYAFKDYKNLLVPAGTGFLVGVLLAATSSELVSNSANLMVAVLV